MLVVVLMLMLVVVVSTGGEPLWALECPVFGGQSLAVVAVDVLHCLSVSVCMCAHRALSRR